MSIHDNDELCDIKLASRSEWTKDIKLAIGWWILSKLITKVSLGKISMKNKKQSF